MTSLLSALGGLALIVAFLNGAIKLFGSNESVARYAGADRDLDLNISVAAIGIVFLALSAILSKLTNILSVLDGLEENGEI